MRLTEGERKWLQRTNERVWRSVHEMTDDSNFTSPHAVSGVSATMSRLCRKGLVEWVVIDGRSNYRLTPAGRKALEEGENG